MSKKKDEKKGTTYIGVIVPNAGSPYEVEVVADSNGTITHKERTWHVSPNSVWNSGKVKRIILPEAVAESFHGGLLAGKFYMTCAMFFYYVKMNLLEQLFNLQNRTPWFKKGSTWIMAGAIISIALVLVWLVISANGSLSHIVDALNRLPQAPDGSATGTGGHNNIAPGGTT